MQLNRQRAMHVPTFLQDMHHMITPAKGLMPVECDVRCQPRDSYTR